MNEPSASRRSTHCTLPIVATDDGVEAVVVERLEVRRRRSHREVEQD